MRKINNYTKSKISKLANIFFTKKSHPKGGVQLIASLYALKPNAREKIIEKLKKYPGFVDLHTIYTEDEVHFLLDNFEYIFREYCDHLSGPFLSADPKDLGGLISSLLKPATEDTRTFIPYVGLNYAIMNNGKGKHDLVLTKMDDPILDIAEEELCIDSVTRITSHPADYIESSVNSGKKYDKIIAIQVFAADPNDMDLLTYDGNFSQELINMASGMLENGGEMAVLIKETACYNRELRAFRQFLVEHSDLYKTTVLRIPISNAPTPCNGCLILVEKNFSHTYHRAICFGDMDHSKFKIRKGNGSYILNTAEIASAFKCEDPKFFIKKAMQELKEGYDLMPTHYPIDEEYRLTSLIQSYISKGMFSGTKSARTLIASLYNLIEQRNQAYINVLKPLIHDLTDNFSEENIQFLLRKFDKVVEFCYNGNHLSGNYEKLTNDYLDLIQTLCFNTGYNRRHNLLLPFGDLTLARACSNSSIMVLSTIEDSKIEWAIAHILKESLSFDVRSFGINKQVYDSVSYDNIIARPNPYGDTHEIINTIIDCIDHKLTDAGTMAILLPRDAAYTSKWMPLREYLAQGREDINVGVISLKIPTSGTPFYEYLVIVEKNEYYDFYTRYSNFYTRDHRIVFVDADKEDFLLSNAEVGCYGLKVQSIIEAIQKHDEKSIISVPSDKLDKGFNFLAARYFRKKAIPRSKAALGKVVYLKDIIRHIPRTEETLVDNGARSDIYLTNQALSDNYLGCRIKLDSIESRSVKLNYTAANGGYVSFANGKVLVGKIDDEPQDRYVGIEKSISHFTVDTNVTSLDYVLKVLSEEDYVAKQAKCLIKGYKIADEYLHADDLLEIRIVLPSLEEQNRQLLEDSKKGYEDKSEEVRRNFEIFRKNMHMQKHKIGQTIGALSSWINLVNYARHLGNGIIEDCAIVIPEYKTSAQEIFDKLTRTAEKLRREILALDSSYGIEKDLEDIALADFLDEYIDTNVWNGFDIVWNSAAHRYAKDIPMIVFDDSDMPRVKAEVRPNEFTVKAGDPKEYIRCTYQSLETILDNIIANARAHGFKQRDKKYQIKFDIEEKYDKVILSVSNNGEPLHSSMESSEVYTYGQTSGDENHSGIGCYQIKEYMDTLKGDVEIISTPNEEFTVTYKLTFVNANPSETINL